MPSNTDRTTVYTIYAGMIPTLGFEAGDFTVERAGNIGRNQTRGKSLNLGTSISPQGKQRKARIRGSVAWYEYSTTVRAIHEEVLDDDARTEGDMLQSGDPANTLRWPSDWRTMFESGNRRLAQEFANSMNPQIMAPTGDEYAGSRGQPSEQETDVGSISIRSPDDELEREQGRLVNRANSVDLYVEGRDGNIYRLDVTSMGMDTSRAHHGLGSLADREAAGVDSASLLRDINSGNIAGAEANLLTYFQGRTDEYNRVIQGLKSHIHELAGGRSSWLANLNIENQQSLDRIQSQLMQNLNSSSTSGSPMSELRPNLRTTIQRLERQGVTAATSQGTEAGFKSAVQFALHALGTLVQSRSTITEYRITRPGAPIPYTIGVQQRMYPDGQQVLEFMALQQADVRIRNEAALENHYLRMELERGPLGPDMIEQIITQNSIDRNYMDAAYTVTQDNTAVEVGAITASSYGDISRDGHNLHLGAQAIISDREFNDSIDNWIRNVGSGHGWRQRVHRFLGSHLQQGPMIAHAGKPADTAGVTHANRYSQIASPINTGGDNYGGTGGLNAFNMLAHGRTLENPYGPGGGQGGGDFSLDVTGATRGFPFTLSDQSRSTIPFQDVNSRSSRQDIASNLMKGAVGNDHMWNNLVKGLSSKSKDRPQTPPTAINPNPIRYFSDDAQGGVRLGNMAMMKGIIDTRRTGIGSGGKTGPARPGTLLGDRRKYWDLDEYLSDDQREGFDDNVNPYWWAAPYISLYYPSGQVGSR